MGKQNKVAPPVDTAPWVLTRSHNSYDQYGEYFVAVFRGKPTHERLARVLAADGYHGMNDVMEALALLESLLNGTSGNSVDGSTGNITYDLSEVQYK